MEITVVVGPQTVCRRLFLPYITEVKDLICSFESGALSSEAGL
jgi:hypothetical protein